MIFIGISAIGKKAEFYFHNMETPVPFFRSLYQSDVKPGYCLEIYSDFYVFQKTVLASKYPNINANTLLRTLAE